MPRNGGNGRRSGDTMDRRKVLAAIAAVGGMGVVSVDAADKRNRTKRRRPKVVRPKQATCTYQDNNDVPLTPGTTQCYPRADSEVIFYKYDTTEPVDVLLYVDTCEGGVTIQLDGQSVTEIQQRANRNCARFEAV